MLVELSVPVTAEVPLEPSGVIVVELRVPVTAEVPFVPAAVTECVCVPSALPENAPAVSVGTPAGHEIAPSANAPAVFVPVGVKLCVCVANADPVNAPAVCVGTPAGHAIVPAGVKAAVPFVPVAVKVCVCVERADPVKVWAVTVRFGAVALQAVNDPVPAAMLVAAQLPLVALAPFVPAGVPPLTALVVADDPVKTCAGTVPADPENAGTPAGQAIVPLATVPAGVPPVVAPVVPALPVNVG